MRANTRVLTCLCWALLCVSATMRAEAGKGKFYIVGMGTAPDLITIRGVEVIKSADIIMVGNEEERDLWKDFIRDKEVWYCPNSLRTLYGIDPMTIKDPQRRARAENGIKARQELVGKIRTAVQSGRIVASLQAGDPMMYGLTFMLEMLPKEIPSEIVPGIGAFEAASAAVKMSPPYGYDTNGVILTMGDWEGRTDGNEKLMASGSTMVFYTMHFDYPKVFSQLGRFYPADTPVAVVCDAGDRHSQKVIRSTVGRFLQEVDYKNLPVEKHILLVGKFLNVGQARKDSLPQNESEHKR